MRPFLAIFAAVMAALLLVASATRAQDPWLRREPLRAERTGTFENTGLTESSGLTASRIHPGVLWTFEDSHTSPVIFATDTLGRDLGAWRVPGARNIDWEAMALAPCAPAACLYIADTGDNDERRSSVTIYRVPEPVPGEPGARDTTSTPESITVRYPDGPHDVEAMVVTSDQNILLVSKGRSGGIRLYRIPTSAWRPDEANRRDVIAESLGRLPLEADGGIASQVTDAALASDGHGVVIRTYADLYFFERDARDRLSPATPPVACSILGLELQGEGITWLDDATLALSTEEAFGVPGGVSVVRCPLSLDRSTP